MKYSHQQQCDKCFSWMSFSPDGKWLKCNSCGFTKPAKEKK